MVFNLQSADESSIVNVIIGFYFEIFLMVIVLNIYKNSILHSSIFNECNCY